MQRKSFTDKIDYNNHGQGIKPKHVILIQGRGQKDEDQDASTFTVDGSKMTG